MIILDYLRQSVRHSDRFLEEEKYFLGWFKVAEPDAKYVADPAINQHNGASAPDTFWSVEVSTLSTLSTERNKIKKKQKNYKLELSPGKNLS